MQFTFLLVQLFPSPPSLKPLCLRGYGMLNGATMFDDTNIIIVKAF